MHTQRALAEKRINGVRGKPLSFFTSRIFRTETEI